MCTAPFKPRRARRRPSPCHAIALLQLRPDRSSVDRLVIPARLCCCTIVKLCEIASSLCSDSAPRTDHHAPDDGAPLARNVIGHGDVLRLDLVGGAQEALLRRLRRQWPNHRVPVGGRLSTASARRCCCYHGCTHCSRVNYIPQFHLYTTGISQACRLRQLYDIIPIYVNPTGFFDKRL